jgi:hypothetical protein
VRDEAAAEMVRRTFEYLHGKGEWPLPTISTDTASMPTGIGQLRHRLQPRGSGAWLSAMSALLACAGEVRGARALLSPSWLRQPTRRAHCAAPQ